MEQFFSIPNTVKAETEPIVSVVDCTDIGALLSVV